MNARTLLLTAALGGFLLAGCAGDAYDDGGGDYAGADFYGDAWYDSGGVYVHPPYGQGGWDRDHHWHDNGQSKAAPGGGHPSGGAHPAPRPVPSVPNTPRPSGGHPSGGGGGGGHSSGGGGGGGGNHRDH